ncbi:helix-turn-helix domain-containing protein [Nonomuraea rosea]|uniref:TetR/AcrR family transcriptional regulator n=1 Tax=Nonomuraea rosea TaxID=638574 RepID=UPI0031EBF4B5
MVAAVEVFAERGIEIALDEVARRAGVGIATLYRHFPTREALIAGAYVREIGLLCDGVDDLLAAMPGDEALIAWMQRASPATWPASPAWCWRSSPSSPPPTRRR